MRAALTGHNYRSTLADLGVNYAELGTAMLDVDASRSTETLSLMIDESDLYFRRNPRNFWIKGLTEKPHITLLHGFMRMEGMGEAVERVIDGQLPKFVTLSGLQVFESDFKGESYDCVVAHVEPDAALKEANDRVRFLPHINTYPDFEPHLTLGYLQKGASGKYLDQLTETVPGTKLDVIGLRFSQPELALPV